MWLGNEIWWERMTTRPPRRFSMSRLHRILRLILLVSSYSLRSCHFLRALHRSFPHVVLILSARSAQHKDCRTWSRWVEGECSFIPRLETGLPPHQAPLFSSVSMTSLIQATSWLVICNSINARSILNVGPACVIRTLTNSARTIIASPRVFHDWYVSNDMSEQCTFTASRERKEESLSWFWVGTVSVDIVGI